MCDWFDETVGELVGFLEAKGLRESTLIVFVVDNGWIQETGGPAEKRRSFAARSKRSPYDGGIRTPILFSWPGHIPASTHDDLVSTIDVAPTILAACDVAVPAEMPGTSLMDVATTGEALDRRAVHGEIFVHTCLDLNEPGLNLTHRWIRHGPWKLIVPESAEEHVELYNISKDPFEKTNLADREPERVASLKGELDSWWKGASR